MPGLFGEVGRCFPALGQVSCRFSGNFLTELSSCQEASVQLYEVPIRATHLISASARRDPTPRATSWRLFRTRKGSSRDNKLNLVIFLGLIKSSKRTSAAQLLRHDSFRLSLDFRHMKRDLSILQPRSASRPKIANNPKQRAQKTSSKAFPGFPCYAVHSTSSDGGFRFLVT